MWTWLLRCHCWCDIILSGIKCSYMFLWNMVKNQSLQLIGIYFFICLSSSVHDILLREKILPCLVHKICWSHSHPGTTTCFWVPPAVFFSLKHLQIHFSEGVLLCQVPTPEHSLREYNSLMAVSCLRELQTKRQQLPMHSKAFLVSTFHWLGFQLWALLLMFGLLLSC